MQASQLHTKLNPKGVRTIYGMECIGKKRSAEVSEGKSNREKKGSEREVSSSKGEVDCARH